MLIVQQWWGFLCPNYVLLNSKYWLFLCALFPLKLAFTFYIDIKLSEWLKAPNLFNPKSIYSPTSAQHFWIAWSREVSIRYFVMATASLLPLPSKETLVKEFVGKSIKDVATPAAVLDLQKLKNNCSRMLEAVESLDCGWRAHIKTHKVWYSSSYATAILYFVFDHLPFPLLLSNSPWFKWEYGYR